MIGLLFIGGITLAFLVGWLLGEDMLINLLFWNGGLSKRQLEHMGYSIWAEGYWHNGRFYHDPMLARAYEEDPRGALAQAAESFDWDAADVCEAADAPLEGCGHGDEGICQSCERWNAANEAEPLCAYHRSQAQPPGFSDGGYPQLFVGTFDPKCARCRAYIKIREYDKLDGFATPYGWYDENGQYHPNGSCS